ncbi:hypothetical protein EBT31_06170, partial [bacterium]|nr:hypothetical protein [bacterium]
PDLYTMELPVPGSAGYFVVFGTEYAPHTGNMLRMVLPVPRDPGALRHPIADVFRQTIVACARIVPALAGYRVVATPSTRRMLAEFPQFDKTEQQFQGAAPHTMVVNLQTAEQEQLAAEALMFRYCVSGQSLVMSPIEWLSQSKENTVEYFGTAILQSESSPLMALGSVAAIYATRVDGKLHALHVDAYATRQEYLNAVLGFRPKTDYVWRVQRIPDCVARFFKKGEDGFFAHIPTETRHVGFVPISEADHERYERWMASFNENRDGRRAAVTCVRSVQTGRVLCAAAVEIEYLCGEPYLRNYSFFMTSTEIVDRVFLLRKAWMGAGGYERVIRWDVGRTFHGLRDLFPSTEVGSYREASFAEPPMAVLSVTHWSVQTEML